MSSARCLCCANTSPASRHHLFQLGACEWWEVQYSKCVGIFPNSGELDTSDFGWMLKEPHVSILARKLKLYLEEGLSS
jgi:hypothetical protein